MGSVVFVIEKRLSSPECESLAGNYDKKDKQILPRLSLFTYLIIERVVRISAPTQRAYIFQLRSSRLKSAQIGTAQIYIWKVCIVDWNIEQNRQVQTIGIVFSEVIFVVEDLRSEQAISN